MRNIFMVVFFSTLAFACLDAFFFIGYLISMAIFGLYQAIFMANAGGCWDNAKKVVETELRAKGTDLHAASVVGDTVGDPFKDTSSVALNPVIKFTTLFGVLAVGLALQLETKNYTQVKYAIAIGSLLISMFFAYRSFYGMRIGDIADEKPSAKKEEKREEKKEDKKEEKKAEAKAEAKAETKDEKKEEATDDKKSDDAKAEG
jgi:K(+)-stimulated pyrophosphate-energized sodium pump